jgi:hypothetical protein
MLRLPVLVFALSCACEAFALPVELAIGDGNFHAIDGSWLQTGIGGSLGGDLQVDGRLVDIHGEVLFDTGALPAELLVAGFDGSLLVVAGALDLQGDGDASSIASFLEFENGMSVYFSDDGLSIFDGSAFRLRGTSWDAGQTPDDVNFALGMELSTKGAPLPTRSASPIPEPASLGLLAAGGLIIGTALRRPLRRD